MARPLRIEFEGAWYHVMNRGAGRRLVFRTSFHHQVFLQLLGEISGIYGVEVHAYCLMGNHYHLLLRTPIAGLGRAMRHLNGVYTQRFNRQVQTDGPLFRGRYNSVLIGTDYHLCCVSRYIHLNPVDAQLVVRPEVYPASSYRALVGLEDAPHWLHTEETLSRFGPGDRRQAYRQFVESGIDEETREFYSRAKLGAILGDDSFRRTITERVRAAGVDSDPERPDARKLVGDRPTLDTIAAAVRRIFEVSASDLRVVPGRRRGSSVARGAFVHLGRHVGGHPLGAIARWIGYRSYAGASKVLNRFRVAMEHDPDIRGRLDEVRRELIGR